MSYPKSCLKRSSVSSVSSAVSAMSTADSWTNAHAPGSLQCPATGLTAGFDLAPCQTGGSTFSTSTAASTGSLAPSTAASAWSSESRPRRKTVTFREEDDVRVYYPPRRPLRKQAKRAAERLFRVCADAFHIDSGYVEYAPEGTHFHDEAPHVHDYAQTFRS
ncbi:hypothetical protein C8Q80DRAFT_1274339 [Daedaleopsis nitida]|nr:hypothetical protein C8Q80DRAFT_1274339 [Daedaleopsis nitida]